MPEELSPSQKSAKTREDIKFSGVEVRIDHNKTDLALKLPVGWEFKKIEKEKNFLKRMIDFFSSREKFFVKDEKGNVVFKVDFQSGFVKIREKGDVFDPKVYFSRLKVLHELTEQITKTSSGKPYVLLKPKKGDVGTVNYLKGMGAKEGAVLYGLSEKDEKWIQASLKKSIVNPKDIQKYGIFPVKLEGNEKEYIKDVIKAGCIPYSDKRINFDNRIMKIKKTAHPLIAIQQYQGALNAGYKPQLQGKALEEVDRYLAASLKNYSEEKQVKITADPGNTTSKEGAFVLKKIKRATRDGFVVGVTPEAKVALRQYLSTLDSPYDKARYRLAKEIGTYGMKNLAELGLVPKIEKHFWLDGILELFGLKKGTLLHKFEMTKEEKQETTVNSGNPNLDNYVTSLLNLRTKVPEEKTVPPATQPQLDLNKSTALLFGQAEPSEKKTLRLDTANNENKNKNKRS